MINAHVIQVKNTRSVVCENNLSGFNSFELKLYFTMSQTIPASLPALRPYICTCRKWCIDILNNGSFPQNEYSFRKPHTRVREDL